MPVVAQVASTATFFFFVLQIKLSRMSVASEFIIAILWRSLLPLFSYNKHTFRNHLVEFIVYIYTCYLISRGCPGVCNVTNAQCIRLKILTLSLKNKKIKKSKRESILKFPRSMEPTEAVECRSFKRKQS